MNISTSPAPDIWTDVTPSPGSGPPDTPSKSTVRIVHESRYGHQNIKIKLKTYSVIFHLSLVGGLEDEFYLSICWQ